MFYSHEILADPKYGVATVWLLATLGAKSQTKKLTRKTIEQVDVPGACETIIKPGAPIALRVQGNLLYGVTAVYSKHSAYLLLDAEKVQSDMLTFYRTLNSRELHLDASAGKAKRQQLILTDDPSFTLDVNLPPLDFDDDGIIRFPGFNFSLHTANASSQLSPLDRSGVGSLINLDVRHSSSGNGSLDQLASPFGDDSLLKPHEQVMPNMFGEEEELPFGDFGLVIDAEGNIIEEPQLPAHPPSQIRQDGEPGTQTGSHAPQFEEQGLVVNPDGDVQMIFGEEALPDAEALPARQPPKKKSEQFQLSDSPVQPVRSRKPRQIHTLSADVTTQISKKEFKALYENYPGNVELARDVPYQVPPYKAKKNAFNFVFGMGIAGIGLPTGIPGLVHPLAESFAGEELQARILGRAEDGEPRGRRRRSASEAFEEETEEEERRVKPRLDPEEGVQQGRAEHDAQVVQDEPMIFGDDAAEVGREPGSALSDHPSSVPWNRVSLIPSSARSQKSAQGLAQSGRQVQESPLVGRGKTLPDIERFSDNMPAFGSEGFGDLPENHSSFDQFGVAAGVSTQEANTSQFLRQALDREGRNFLEFVENVAAEKGEEDEEEESRRWVDFDGLFEPQDKKKPVVAQAFLHVLTLATKNKIKVHQDGLSDKIPFGAISIGVQGQVDEFEDALESLIPEVLDDDE